MEDNKTTAQDDASSDLVNSPSQSITDSDNDDISNSNIGQPQTPQPDMPIVQQLVPSTPSSFLSNQSTTTPSNANPITVVIQWLTYAFWGWTAIAIMILASMILNYYILEMNIGDALPYSIASVLVLLPIAVICDSIYRKKEPAKKIGAYSIVMVIHAVIFALCFVGALVTLVLGLINLLIETSDSSNIQVLIYSAIIMVVVYAVLFFRTIIPEKLFKFRFYTVIFMSLISIALVVIGFVGPVADTMRTKDDRLIEDNLSYIVDGVNKYVDEYGDLPDSLENITLGDDAKTLVSKNLVKYINEGESTDYDNDYGYEKDEYSYFSSKTFKYQLCVDYIKKSTSNTYGRYDYMSDYSEISKSDGDDDYSTYASTYSHPEGEVCYKLTTQD